MRTLVILVILSIFLAGCTTQNQKIIINDKTFYVEMADDPIERAQGLMFREKLEENSGMLFIFDSSEKHSFWMKNTLIPLDMIWIDDNLEVVDIQAAFPCTSVCESYIPKKPAKYVLELNYKSAEENNINLGDKVIL